MKEGKAEMLQADDRDTLIRLHGSSGCMLGRVSSLVRFSGGSCPLQQVPMRIHWGVGKSREH
jgi:hypothetical protein